MTGRTDDDRRAQLAFLIDAARKVLNDVPAEWVEGWDTDRTAQEIAEEIVRRYPSALLDQVLWGEGDDDVPNTPGDA